MDLIAYSNKDNKLVDKYIRENYGDIPRPRGIRFMKIEQKLEENEKPNMDVLDMFGNEEEYDVDYTETSNTFNKYVGKDVIYIHTRCGDCDLGYDNENSNYVYCGAKEWEEEHKDLFLEHITDPFDSTYCTHYFKAVINEDYEKILELAKEEDE